MSFRLVTMHDRVKMRLALQLGAKTEVLCRVGRVDVMTNTEAIEVKPVNRWKNGLGQAIAYGSATNKLPRLHLYGKQRLGNYEEEIITGAGVRLSYDFDPVQFRSQNTNGSTCKYNVINKKAS